MIGNIITVIAILLMSFILSAFLSVLTSPKRGGSVTTMVLGFIGFSWFGLWLMF